MNKSISIELKAIFHLAIPIVVNLLAYMGMQLVDVVMLGRLGPLALASSAVGNVMYVLMLVGGVGIITAVGILCAQAYGDKNFTKVTIIAQQGMWIALFLTIPTIIFILMAPSFLLL